MGLFSKIFKKTQEEALLEPLDIGSLIKNDMHSHIIHGIDDGSDSLENSLEIIKGLQNFGYQKLLCTPHVMNDFYRNSSDTILSRLDEIRNALEKTNSPIELDASAEYYFDEELNLRLKKNDILSFGKEKYLLFEFSYFNEHHGVTEGITDMFMKGYTPVLAHPERYPYFVSDLEKYNKLKELGVKFQLNLLSFTGHYGESAIHGANYLIDNNFVDFIGTDIHRLSHLPIIAKALKNERLHKLVNTGNLLNSSLS